MNSISLRYFGVRDLKLHTEILQLQSTDISKRLLMPVQALVDVGTFSGCQPRTPRGASQGTELMQDG